MVGNPSISTITYDQLYHGSREKVECPKIYSRNANKDFGVGFYCTEIYQQAYKWAVRGFLGKGVVNIYRFPREALLQLNIKVFEGMSEEWLDFIAKCRIGEKHTYDIVIGPMADDTVFNRVNEYINGALTREQFWELCRFRYPTHQICFCTEEALEYLVFEKSEEVSE